jgi:hypothetical protein
MFPLGLTVAAIDSGVQHGQVLVSQQPTRVPQATTFVFLGDWTPGFIFEDIAPRKLAIWCCLYTTMVVLTVADPFRLAVATLSGKNWRS